MEVRSRVGEFASGTEVATGQISEVNYRMSDETDCPKDWLDPVVSARVYNQHDTAGMTIHRIPF